MVKTMSVTSLLRHEGRRNKSPSAIAIVYLLLCFLSAIDVLIRLVFIVTETPQHDRKAIEVPRECTEISLLLKLCTCI